MFRALVITVLTSLTGSAGAAANMFVYVDPQGTVHVTDRRGDTRFVPYTPGDFERWADGQPAVPHRGAAPPARVEVTATPYDDLIDAAAARYDLDRRLLWAVIAVESGFRAKVVSRAGAQGLMQLMPATAADLGVTDALDPAQNIDGGARYLAGLLKSFDDPRLALAAYNAGPGRVRRLMRVPHIPETQAYVADIMRLWGKG